MSNYTEKKQLLILFFIGLATVFSIAFALGISPLVFVDDTAALYRFMLLKVPTMLMDAFILIGALVMFDFLTPDDTLVNINQDPMSASILCSSLLIGLAIAIAFG